MSSRLHALSIFASILLAMPAFAQDLLNIKGGCNYFGVAAARSVYGFASDEAARNAAAEIMKHTGLPQNFTIMAANVDNAEATIDNYGRRLILYNQQFMLGVIQGTGTDWSAASILAHEIGHHLSGHTFVGGGSKPPIELEADKFSGFVLYNMGSSLEEAQAAMRLISSPDGSSTHPPKSARLAAITNGFIEAREMDGKVAEGNERSQRLPPPDHPPPRRPSLEVVIGNATYTHDISVHLANNSHAPGMQIVTHGRVEGGAGHTLQLVATFSYFNGPPLIANPYESHYRTSTGHVGAPSHTVTIQGSHEALSNHPIVIPYYALGIAPSNYVNSYSLAFTVWVYLDGQLQGQTTSIAFPFRW